MHLSVLPSVPRCPLLARRPPGRRARLRARRARGAGADVLAGSAYVPDEVVVRYEPSATARCAPRPSAPPAPAQPQVFAPRTRVLKSATARASRPTIAAARRRARRPQRDAERASPARASSPTTPAAGGAPGGWQACSGTSAPGRRQRARRLGPAQRRRAPRRARRQVAVLDTGVAYATRRGFRARPTCSTASSRATTSSTTTPTPTTATATARTSPPRSREATSNAFGVTGLAYGARIMPVRVLDRAGEGDASRSAPASASPPATARRSSTSPSSSTRASRAARSPTSSTRCATPAARARSSSAPRATSPPTRSPTRRARRTCCRSAPRPSTAARPTTPTPARASTSPRPGGGPDAEIPGDPNCRPGAEPAGRDIYQVTYTSRTVRRFGLPERLRGHVDGRAARLGHRGAGDRLRRDRPEPDARRRSRSRLKATARDLGTPGPDSRYGAGLLDAARAVTPASRRYVVRMISTVQGAWCETLFGTEPSRKRLAPVMPLLPTTIRSACVSSATSRIASAGVALAGEGVDLRRRRPRPARPPP